MTYSGAIFCNIPIKNLGTVTLFIRPFATHSNENHSNAMVKNGEYLACRTKGVEGEANFAGVLGWEKPNLLLFKKL